MEILTQHGATILAVVSAFVAAGAMLAAVSQARSARGSRLAADESVTQTRRSADAAQQSAVSAKDAVLEARRSADAAETSASAAERSARADEIMAALAEQQASQYRIPWKFQLVKGQTYLLVNEGDEPARDVRLEGESIVGHQQPTDVDARSSVEFLNAPGWGSDKAVTVRWRRPDEVGGEEKVWSGIPS